MSFWNKVLSQLSLGGSSIKENKDFDSQIEKIPYQNSVKRFLNEQKQETQTEQHLKVIKQSVQSKDVISCNQNDEMSEVGSLDDAYYQNDDLNQKKRFSSKLMFFHVPTIEIHQVDNNAEDDSCIGDDTSNLDIYRSLSGYKNNVDNKNYSDIENFSESSRSRNLTGDSRSSLDENIRRFYDNIQSEGQIDCKMKTEQVTFLDKKKSSSEVVYDQSLTNSLDDVSYNSQTPTAVTDSQSNGIVKIKESKNKSFVSNDNDQSSQSIPHRDQLSFSTKNISNNFENHTENEDSTATSDDVIVPLNSMTVSQHISTCGSVVVAVQYSLMDKLLQITVVRAFDLPNKDRGGASILQARLVVVMPQKKKRYRTHVQHINNPNFNKTFKMHRMTPDVICNVSVRIRLYGIGKMKDRLIGEASIRLEEINLIREPQLTLTLLLEPRADINVSV